MKFSLIIVALIIAKIEGQQFPTSSFEGQQQFAPSHPPFASSSIQYPTQFQSPYYPKPGFQPSIPNESPQNGSGVISTHVLNIASGRPAAGVNCSAFWWDGGRGNWLLVGTSRTNEQGRIPSIVTPELLPPNPGIYKIRFETAPYFGAIGQQTFFPFVEVVFGVNDPTQKYHVPLTLSNFGYSTYRGQ